MKEDCINQHNNVDENARMRGTITDTTRTIIVKWSGDVINDHDDDGDENGGIVTIGSSSLCESFDKSRKEEFQKLIVHQSSSVVARRSSSVAAGKTARKHATTTRRSSSVAAGKSARKHATKRNSSSKRKSSPARNAKNKTKRKSRKKDTPGAVKGNPMNVASRPGETSAIRMSRSTNWGTALRMHSVLSPIDRNNQGMVQEHFRHHMTGFEIDDAYASSSSSDEENNESNFEEDFIHVNSFNRSATIEEEGATFSGYKFCDEETDEFPDLDAEDAEALGDGGIPPGLEVNGQWANDGTDNRLNFVYGDVPQNCDRDETNYAPEQSELRSDIPKSAFATPFAFFMHTSGMNEDFWRRRARAMTQYVHKMLTPNHNFAGYPWNGQNFSANEVIRNLGIILKISLDGRTKGSYRQYFVQTSSQFISVGTSRTYRVELHKPWARDYTSFARFTQFLGAFRGELEPQDGAGDKAYQLRPFINAINQGSQYTFIPGKNLSFDEGGIASRSRRNPIRQYNKDKPKKFQVDFFILSTAREYVIIHLDVYQGKNASNINIHHEAKPFPTTQKVLINAIIQAKIANSERGVYCVFCDSRYGAPLCFKDLADIHVVLGVATMSKNRKGWDSEIMDMTTASAERGESLVKYDKVNKMIAGQWNDNKVVSFISTIPEFGIVDVQRRKGRELLNLKVPKPLKSYQENMGGVDRGDQIRETSGGGFCKGLNKAGKWYKLPCLGIMDFGTLNSSQGWNMEAAKDADNNIHKCTYLQYQTCMTVDMLHHECAPEQAAEGHLTINNTSSATNLRWHALSFSADDLKSSNTMRCKVCQLDSNFRMRAHTKLAHAKMRGAKHKNYMGKCLQCNVFLHADATNVQENSCQKLFLLDDFSTKTCTEIFHHPRCIGLSI